MTIPAQAVFIPKLNVHGWLVRVVPSSVPHGVTKYRCCWREPAAGGAYRAANFFLEDVQFEAAEAGAAA